MLLKLLPNLLKPVSKELVDLDLFWAYILLECFSLHFVTSKQTTAHEVLMMRLSTETRGHSISVEMSLSNLLRATVKRDSQRHTLFALSAH